MTRIRPLLHARLVALAAVAAASLTLAACSDYGNLPKEMRPLPKETRELITKKGMKDTAPVLVRIYKEESKLEIWKRQEATGRFAYLKSFDICKWSGELGPKKVEGDRQAPEGFYTITPAQMNPKSSYYLSFNLGYPNAFDKAHGRTGAHLMVHGACSSAGCYSMTDEQMEEIYSLGRLAFQGGQRSFQVQAYPFRMTAENMARHHDNPNMPFWRMLKEGSDHFELTGQVPKVDICDRRYVFNATSEGGAFDPTSACPPMSVPPQISQLIAQKQAEDDAKASILIAQLETDEERVKAKAAAAAVEIAAAPQPAAPENVGSISVARTQAAPAAPQAAPAAQPEEAGGGDPPAPPRQERGGLTGFLTRVLR